MTALAHDRLPATRTRAGLALALASAISFGASGALADPLMAGGWSPGAVTLIRIAVGGLAVLPFALVALGGRWALLRRNAGLLARYGLVAVVLPQFCYFSAVQYLPVGTALLIEFTAPAVVVVWMWLRHGQRPGPLTLAGAALAAVGLVLVLQLLTGTPLDPRGVLWALAAMVGVVAYFVLSANGEGGLPPLTLAAGGLLVGAATLGTLGLAGLLPLRAGAAGTEYAGHTLASPLALVGLGLLTAAVSYGTGIAAGRRLGSRLASFVALSELIFGVLWAWALLAQVPRPVQVLGGALILGGVLVVKLGERTVTSAPADPLPTPAI